MAEVVLVGASGLAREVLAVLRENRTHEVVGILDDNATALGTTFDGVRVIGALAQVTRYPRSLTLVCVGSGRAREDIVGRLKALGVDSDRFATLIDPSVRNPAGCRIGAGSILLANVSLTTAVTIGSHVVVMPGVTLTHDDRIDDYATITAGVSLGGGVRVGRGAYLGMNASVRQWISIGRNATLGMGAALLEDLPEGETWVGVPARPLRSARELALSPAEERFLGGGS